MNVWTCLSTTQDNIPTKIGGMAASIWAYPILSMDGKPDFIRILLMLLQIPWAVMTFPLMVALFIPFTLLGIAIDMWRESA